jgi:hypothetical protein
MVTVKLTLTVYEEASNVYTAEDDSFSPACWEFLHKAIDNRPTRNKASTFDVTQEEVNAFIDEVLSGMIDIHDNEDPIDGREASMRYRVSGAFKKFIQDYYKK